MNMPSSPSPDLLHIARSRFLDEFSGVESAVGACLTHFGVASKGRFKQDMETLRKVPPSPRLSKKRWADLQTIVDGVKPLNEVRCDIVHGRMHAVWIDGQCLACVINPLSTSKLGCRARLLNRGQIEVLSKELRAFAANLMALISPPSSQPRPLPDAAGDP